MIPRPKKLKHKNALGLFEIRMESIGGLGANLAGKMLAEAGVLIQGYGGSHFSSYGSEKKGSPVRTFVRFSETGTPVRDIAPVEEPHVVAVFHEALFHTQPCLSGLHADGVLIVNTRKSPEEIAEQTHLASGTVVCIDALGISMQEKTRVNTAMLGALCRVVDFVDPKAVKSVISETFSRKYPQLAEANLRTFDRGYNEVRMTDLSGHDKPERHAYSRPAAADGYATQSLGGAIVTPGNSILRDLSSSRQGSIPAFNRETCIHCAACDQVCPDFCFVFAPENDARGRTIPFLQGIDYQYCKGCMKCVEACPTDALQTISETPEYVRDHNVPHAWRSA